MINQKTIAPTTLVESVYCQIKQDITTAYLKPNEKINIKQLCQRYDTSGTPIKQALNRLISEELVISVPRRGMRVRPFTRKEINDVFQIRLMVETFFIDQIIERLSKDQKCQLKIQLSINEHIKAINSCQNRAQMSAVYSLDQKFHELCLSCSGNHKIAGFFHTLHSPLYSPLIYTEQPSGKLLEYAKEHQLILDALIAGNPNSAQKHITFHIENTLLSIFTALNPVRSDKME